MRPLLLCHFHSNFSAVALSACTVEWTALVSNVEFRELAIVVVISQDYGGSCSRQLLSKWFGWKRGFVKLLRFKTVRGREDRVHLFVEDARLAMSD
jgi:hypothetical protein